MRLLLDTHALLWWWMDDPQLSRPAHAAIADLRNEVYVSAASVWEISTKQRIGKLEGIPAMTDQFFQLVEADGFHLLSISPAHALRAGSLTAMHRDPFDRMLAAQSELETMPLVTRDPAFAEFQTATLW
ncbi:type II toxin-antitoxin system VapC family toxin [uncultured Sphaerotilus sp.]|uniref:type II toxin-antitoxin system VapC family toxin n=1 Tax=uncultured Sphaerotilus sp. TaxID=474984 RepID=UPI0030CA5B43